MQVLKQPLLVYFPAQITGRFLTLKFTEVLNLNTNKYVEKENAN